MDVPTGLGGLIGLFLGTVMLLNVLIGVFNLLPIPPLDGSKILPVFLPREIRGAYERLSNYGFLLLILLIFLPYFGLPGLGSIISPILSFLIPVFAGS